MSNGLAGPRGRDAGLVWGTVAELCIVPAVYVWIRSPDAGDRALFGRPASLTVLVVALALTAIGAVSTAVAWYGERNWSRGRRLAIAGPSAAVAAGVAALALGGMATARTGADVVLGGLLLAGAAAMVAVAVWVVRVRATASGDRLRARFEQLRKDGS